MRRCTSSVRETRSLPIKGQQFCQCFVPAERARQSELMPQRCCRGCVADVWVFSPVPRLKPSGADASARLVLNTATSMLHGTRRSADSTS
ncbi:unnamed protein product [Gadus morhua 'NCC']